jgi:citrate lyase subunit beta/citryl-CoA lyase
MSAADRVVTEAVTYLFVPASEERKVTKALASDADAVILDLEDGVAEGEKPAARRLLRDALARWCAGTRAAVWVRVNSADPHLTQDIASVDWARVAGAVFPMAEASAPLQRLRDAGAARLLPLIETAAGFDALHDLATIEGVDRFAIGTYDLALDLGLLTVADPDDGELIWQLRGALVLRSRQLNLQPPVDGVYARIDDDGGLRAVCERARRFGFSGKLLIHPGQIVIARETFAPSADELQFAREIVAAYDAAADEGRGAIRVRGRMIDRPMAVRARAFLGRWA